MVLVGASFPDAKAQVAAEVTCEPRTLLKTTHLDNSGISAQPTTGDGRSWTSCPLTYGLPPRGQVFCGAGGPREDLASGRKGQRFDSCRSPQHDPRQLRRDLSLRLSVHACMRGHVACAADSGEHDACGGQNAGQDGRDRGLPGWNGMSCGPPRSAVLALSQARMRWRYGRGCMGAGGVGGDQDAEQPGRVWQPGGIAGHLEDKQRHVYQEVGGGQCQQPGFARPAGRPVERGHGQDRGEMKQDPEGPRPAGGCRQGAGELGLQQPYEVGRLREGRGKPATGTSAEERELLCQQRAR